MTIALAHRQDGPDGAPPLVLLNSVGSSTAMWEPCLGPLAEQFRVVRIDHRGHGDSPAAPPETPATIADLAADVLATMDDLGLGRVHLAGLSLGGMIAMWIASHAPERVGRVALLCTTPHMPTADVYRDRATAVRSGGTAPLADAVVARWIRPTFAQHDPAAVERMKTMFTAVDAESYAQCCEAIGAMDLRPDLARIAAPTLVIGASDDVATPPEQQHLIGAAVAGSRVEIVPDAAHVATYEQPGLVARLMLEHFTAGATLAAGFGVRRAVLGDEYVDAALAASTELTDPFQEFITRYAWGGVWTRPDLTRRERSIATLSALVTLGGVEGELAAHLLGAVRNGLAPAEILELLQHLAIYAGVPKANRAVGVARDVLDESS